MHSSDGEQLHSGVLASTYRRSAAHWHWQMTQMFGTKQVWTAFHRGTGTPTTLAQKVGTPESLTCVQLGPQPNLLTFEVKVARFTVASANPGK